MHIHRVDGVQSHSGSRSKATPLRGEPAGSVCTLRPGGVVTAAWNHGGGGGSTTPVGGGDTRPDGDTAGPPLWAPVGYGIETETVIEEPDEAVETLAGEAAVAAPLSRRRPGRHPGA